MPVNSFSNFSMIFLKKGSNSQAFLYYSYNPKRPSKCLPFESRLYEERAEPLMKKEHTPTHSDSSDWNLKKNRERAAASDDGTNRQFKNNVFSEDKKYRIKSDFILREIAGEYAIIPVGSEKGHSLENTMMAPNESAVFLWRCFEHPSTVSDAAAKGVLEYDVDEDTMRKAVEKFVAESLAYGILEEVK